MADEKTGAQGNTEAAAAGQAQGDAAGNQNAGTPNGEQGKTPTDGQAPAGGSAAQVPAGPPAEYNLNLPQGATFSDESMALFKAEARTLGLTNEAAQKWLDDRADQVAAAAAGYLAELKADPELGGAKFAASMELAKAGRDVIAPPGTPEAEYLNRLFEETGIGNHPLLVRIFHRAGKLSAEDTVGQQPGGGGGKKERTREEIMYGVPGEK